MKKKSCVCINLIVVNQLILFMCPLYAQESVSIYNIILKNDRNENVIDAPVSISLNQLKVPFIIQSVIATDGDIEIPSQLDDLDKDGIADELAFVIDVPPHSVKTVRLQISPDASNKQYPARVYAEMLLHSDKGKHQPIKSLTVPGTSNIYNLLRHHGPAFESELVAYRIYFDRKQTVDIYGKFNKQLEIEESQFYPTDEQLARGFGDDVLRVSGSCGLGTLKGWNGKKAIHIEPVATRTESILATGPVRAIVDVDVNGWQYQGSDLDMKVRYTLYAGHRDCEVRVDYGRPLRDEIFSVGLQNIRGSESYSDGEGLLACWGTDWPVNDTIKYARETVGLAVCLPDDIICGQQNDQVNYLYQISKPDTSGFTYYINFTSMKETFGYKTKDDWFEYVRRWKQELEEPLRIEIKEQ